MSASNQRLLSQVGGGILGGLVGGLLGAGAGVVMDLRRCMLWCSPQPSHVPRTTLLGAGAGAFSGVFIATALTDAPTAEAAQEARLERILIDPRARSLGLSGRF